VKVKAVMCGGPRDGQEVILERVQLGGNIQPEGLPTERWRWDGTKDQHSRYRLRPIASPAR
jgi:hypothetical protein